MPKIASGVAALALTALLALPAVASADADSPYGLESNPIGTLRWLPRDANEPAGDGPIHRLVVVYDQSVDPDTGEETPLLAKGTFGVKLFTASPDVSMFAHSDDVTSIDDITAPEAGPVDSAFMGVAGDVRGGDCAKVGTPDFHEAYSATRTFFHPGESPYEAVSQPGTCEVVDTTEPVVDEGTGAILGHTTTVTNHVPGFWIDVAWPERSIGVGGVIGLGTGYLNAEIWYGTVFDTEGQDAEWYEAADTTGHSTSVGAPGDYTDLFRFTANPGSPGDGSCPAFPSAPQAGTTNHQDVTVEVPEGSTKATFLLFPKGDWDLRVFDPLGASSDSGNFGGLHEEVVVPSTAAGGIASLTPGTYTMRACNYTGEPEVLGAVIIE